MVLYMGDEASDLVRTPRIEKSKASTTKVARGLSEGRFGLIDSSARGDMKHVMPGRDPPSLMRPRGDAVNEWCPKMVLCDGRSRKLVDPCVVCAVWNKRLQLQNRTKDGTGPEEIPIVPHGFVCPRALRLSFFLLCLSPSTHPRVILQLLLLLSRTMEASSLLLPHQAVAETISTG